jgi:hypothetical protein
MLAPQHVPRTSVATQEFMQKSTLLSRSGIVRENQAKQGYDAPSTESVSSPLLITTMTWKREGMVRVANGKCI